MNLTTLTDPRAVCVQAQFTSRDEAIRQLATRLVALGKIADADTFLAEFSIANRLARRRWARGWPYPMVNQRQ
ncbi:hypothetical protein [Enterobacter hormaechei]|uniref:hypothetical protein n=1 Tax=Enterobacter hormaechei TaxID=158836 RepID=UPI000B197F14